MPRTAPFAGRVAKDPGIMLVRDGDDFLELTVADRGAAGTPDAGDTPLTADRVSSP
jgi:hypothetical protein